MTEETEKIRCFISIDLPRDVMNSIEKLQKQIREKKLFDGKTTELENLHLTLKFLGEVDLKMIEEIKTILSKIKFKEFEVKLNGLGVFSRDRIRIVWIKLNGKGIFDLQKQIDDKLKNLFSKEIRFMGHVTIARVRRVSNKNGFLEYIDKIKIPEIKFKVDKFYLNKSELFETGPIYKEILEVKSSN
jgi:RNA 2',3'-cyclic 3'-phosphodiesterase